MKTCLLAILLIFSAGVLSQDLLISQGTLHVGDGSTVIENTDILITDGRIAKIAPRIPTNKMIRVINAQGRHVTPAFFAGLTASGLTDVEAVSESVDSGYRDLFTGLMHPEIDVRKAYNPLTSVIPVTRVEGFGYTLLTASQSDMGIAGQGGMVRFDGGFTSFDGKDVIYVDLSGHAAHHFGGSRAAQWQLIEQAFAESNIKDAEYLELLSVAGAKALSNAKREGIFVFRVNRAADIHRLINFAQEQKISAVVHGGREAWIVAKQLAEAEMPVVLNALDNLPADFDSLGARLDNAALLHQAGVTVMFSSGETHNARKVRQVAGNAVANGFPHSAGIQSMTSIPADIFGGESRLAAKGAIADLVVWSGDPLDVSSIAEAVVIGGIPDTMTSRQTKLRDRYLPESTELPRSYIKP
jgi:hypothetical protein